MLPIAAVTKASVVEEVFRQVLHSINLVNVRSGVMELDQQRL